MAVRDACWWADVVIQRVRDLAIAEARASAAAFAASDAQIERVCAEAPFAGVTRELEREHKESVALQRYARAPKLRWASALEGIVARGRLRGRRP